MTATFATESFPALGSQATVAVADRACLSSVRAVVEEVVSSLDLACSRFREDSELSAVNRAAGDAVPVSPLFLECCTAAVRAALLTDGDVDPTVGEALVALGYDRDFDDLDPDDNGAPQRSVKIAPVPGWRMLRLDLKQKTVRVPRGVKLDFGATAKALGADRAAAAGYESAGSGVLVSLGGDIGLAGPPPPGGWPVRVTDDHRSDSSAPGQWITLRSGGLATSSTSTRRWSTGQGPRHHLVDPATGGNADPTWRTVSVAAATCLEANIASTAAIVRGQAAPAWLEQLELPARLVSQDGRVLHLAGWSHEGDELIPLEATVR